MFDLYVDGTKIEISRFFSDLNVPLIRPDPRQYKKTICDISFIKQKKKEKNNWIFLV